MRYSPLIPALVILLVPALPGQCPKDRDERLNKQTGLLVSDLIVSGTQAMTSDELAAIRNGLVGWCINDDRDEVEGRIRDLFQTKGTSKW